MRMRQSLAEIEEAFAEEIQLDRQRRQRLRRNAIQRSQKRRVYRQHKQGSVRFLLLWLALLATAIIVAVAMFEALYLVMG